MQPRSLSALDVYKRLIELSAELEEMAGKCWGVADETALKTAAKLVRALASGYFIAGFSSHNHEDRHENPNPVRRPSRLDDILDARRCRD